MLLESDQEVDIGEVRWYGLFQFLLKILGHLIPAATAVPLGTIRIKEFG